TGMESRRSLKDAHRARIACVDGADPYNEAAARGLGFSHAGTLRRAVCRMRWCWPVEWDLEHDSARHSGRYIRTDRHGYLVGNKSHHNPDSDCGELNFTESAAPKPSEHSRNLDRAARMYIYSLDREEISLILTRPRAADRIS